MGLSIASLNCNSLNLASSTEHYDAKINAISNLKQDIIFLCDLRLGEIANQKGDNKIKTSLLKSNLKNHELFLNSTLNKRGVAILIHKKTGIRVINEHRDQDENILILECSTGEKKLVLGSVYGPNNTCRTFYNSLRNILSNYRDVPTVLGGDWNTTWDGSDPDHNIDIHNMVRPPNCANGRLLRNLSDEFGLTYPF
jgi:exonuclease III